MKKQRLRPARKRRFKNFVFNSFNVCIRGTVTVVEMRYKKFYLVLGYAQSASGFSVEYHNGCSGSEVGCWVSSGPAVGPGENKNNYYPSAKLAILDHMGRHVDSIHKDAREIVSPAFRASGKKFGDMVKERMAMITATEVYEF